jgi:GTP-binding protein
MKFVDQATIVVSSGDGGPGCLSFRREKYIPRGGPDGGDGGRGGHVILAASSQKDTLFRFHMNQHFRAENGLPGQGKNKQGRNGADLIIHLPVGTASMTGNRGLPDRSHPTDQTFIIAEGGMAARQCPFCHGHQSRAPLIPSPERRANRSAAPRTQAAGRCRPGRAAQRGEVHPDLPHSAARPKIADYPFTTLVPNLGVVAVDSEHSFVVADIPGLIEGASQGAGLGHRFLRHVQRCRVLVHLLDAGQTPVDDPLGDFHRINAELAAFDPSLAEKPQIVALNKMDLTERKTGSPAAA